MEKIHKTDYKVLKYFSDNTRIDVLKQKQDKECKIEDKVEKRLIKLGYIDFNSKAKNLYHEEHVITKKGNEHYLKLRENWRKDLTIYIAIVALLIAIVSAYYSYQSHLEILSIVNQTINNTIP